MGISTHSSWGDKNGTSLVTNLHDFCGSRLQVSSGTYLFDRKKNIENLRLVGVLQYLFRCKTPQKLSFQGSFPVTSLTVDSVDTNFADNYLLTILS